MNLKMPKECPACSREMHVRKLMCPACSTEVHGDFILGRFSQLDNEKLEFLEIFIKFRGNLKDVGNELGISYPTARNRLDILIETLGFENSQDNQTISKEKKIEALKRLKDGELNIEETISILKGGEENE